MKLVSSYPYPLSVDGVGTFEPDVPRDAVPDDIAESLLQNPNFHRVEDAPPAPPPPPAFMDVPPILPPDAEEVV